MLVYDPAELDTPLNWLKADLAAAKGLPLNVINKSVAEKATSKGPKDLVGKGVEGSAEVDSGSLGRRDTGLSQSSGNSRHVVGDEGVEDDGDTSY